MRIPPNRNARINVGFFAKDRGFLAMKPSMGSESKQACPRLDAATLFRAHGRYVAGFLARLGVATSELDDLVQEVFLVAHRRGGFLDDARARPTTWLAAIAIRVVSTSKRSKRRSKERADMASIASTSSDAHCPARATENRESIERIQRALATLDTRARGVFMLFEIEGKSCTAIAHALEIPVGTVYSRLHQARKSFKAAYARVDKPSPSTFGLQQAGVSP